MKPGDSQWADAHRLLPKEFQSTPGYEAGRFAAAPARAAHHLGVSIHARL